jgi:hypothetical protein
MKKLMFTVFILVLALPMAAYGKAWYVRPAGGDYGLENGTSYENAWDGLEKVVWGTGGVQPGDNLWVCGTHVRREVARGNLVLGGRVYPISGTSDDQRVTIRGDFPNDPGIVWGAYLLREMSKGSWTNEGGNVWSIPLEVNHTKDWYFQDIGKPNPDSYTVLDKEESLEGVKANPGSFYSEDFAASSKLYVHLTDGGAPGGRVYAPGAGYGFRTEGQKYITFYKIKFFQFTTPVTSIEKPATHITFDGCTIMYGTRILMRMYNGSDYFKILNCELAWAGNGLYTISLDNNAPSNYLFKGNHIHDIGVRKSTWDADAHAIGIQGGFNGIIEDNYIERCGTGPLLYCYANQSIGNVTIRRNFIKDLHQNGGCYGGGITLECSNDGLQDKKGMVIIQNIVTNVPGWGIAVTYEDLQIVANNTVANCKYGFYAGRNFKGLGPSILLRNNIFYNSGETHIWWRTGAQEYVMDSNKNFFYPDNKNSFKRGSGTILWYTLSQWQELEKTGSMFDPNSFTDEPLFVNASGTLSEPEDFQVKAGSPVVDKGVTVNGIETDFGGNLVVGAFDIGAWEYKDTVTASSSPASSEDQTPTGTSEPTGTSSEEEPTTSSQTGSTSEGTTVASSEPSTTEPSGSTTEPTTTEPTTTEPTTTEPTTTEPTTTEPTATEPATTETTGEGSSTPPTSSEPESTTEPSTSEPATTEPAASEGPASTASTTEPTTTTTEEELPSPLDPDIASSSTSTSTSSGTTTTSSGSTTSEPTASTEPASTEGTTSTEPTTTASTSTSSTSTSTSTSSGSTTTTSGSTPTTTSESTTTTKTSEPSQETVVASAEPESTSSQSTTTTTTSKESTEQTSPAQEEVTGKKTGWMDRISKWFKRFFR